MDAKITRTNKLFKLVNKETGKVEMTELRPITASDEQNKLWARGIKTTIVEE